MHNRVEKKTSGHKILFFGPKSINKIRIERSFSRKNINKVRIERFLISERLES